MASREWMIRMLRSSSGFCAMLLAASGFCSAQDAPLKVTITSKRMIVYRYQTVTLRLTVENTGEKPTPMLKREEILGKKNFLCALAVPSGPAGLSRESRWAEPAGKPRTGSIGSLEPGESFITGVEIKIPEELTKAQTTITIQWAGTIGEHSDLRSTEIQVSLRDGTHPIATVETSAGDFTFELLEDKAPNHVSNFIHLTRAGFYDGLTIHRVVMNFIIQSGSPDGSPKGGPGYTIPFEANDTEFKKGVIGMVTIGNDKKTGGSQWFACVRDALDFKGTYTAFGKILEGQDVVDRISRSPASNEGQPRQAIRIRRLRVVAPETYELPPVKKNEDLKKDEAQRKDGK